MGCDIHLHIEVKLNDKWEHYGVPNISRNYRLFEKMAGVRGDITEAISPPKGIPEDITILTQYDIDRWEGDGHSHSWLGAEEISKLEDWLQNGKPSISFQEGKDLEHHILHTYLFDNGFSSISEERLEGITDVRFVFWFDN